ncbi:MAG: ATP-binding protein [Bdellovibrionaceae bacterium]|nr:ATP-binding protein [Pseudobdellovibrionaceae bacterium]
MIAAKKIKKIVITGAPSSGKSSIAQYLTDLNLPNILVVPETARILLSAGFPIPTEPAHIFDFQKAVLSLQKTLEYSIQQNHSPTLTHVILDRGAIDGAVFWPHGMDHFFRTFHLDYEYELSRYDHVIFPRLPDQDNFGKKDSLRFHTFEESLEAEIKLQTLWSKHLSYTEIPAQKDFQKKIDAVIQTIITQVEIDRATITSAG